jgi:hypothetical protein
MKILLDENIDVRFKFSFDSDKYQVLTVKDMGWNGIKNGKLLKLAADMKFDAFVCVDKNLPYQQNLQNLSIPVLVINVHKNVLSNLQLFLPAILKTLEIVSTKKIYIVEKTNDAQ